MVGLSCGLIWTFQRVQIRHLKAEQPPFLECWYSCAVKKTLLFILLAAATAPGLPQNASVQKPVPDVAAGRSIHQMFEDDQSEVPANMPNGVSPITYEEFSRRRQLRCARIQLLLDSGLTLSAQDFHDAAYLFQHGETADDYLMAHILAVEAVIRGDQTSKWIAASTLDRYLQIIHRPQVFGTQYPRDEKAYEQIKGNNFQGRTQNPFDDKFLPNAVRLDFCVPSLEQQKKNLASLNAGAYPDATMVAPGCKR